MKQAIRKHFKDFLAVIALFLVALVVGGVILSKQRLYLPHWVPLVGSDFVDRQFEIATAGPNVPMPGIARPNSTQQR